MWAALPQLRQQLLAHVNAICTSTLRLFVTTAFTCAFGQQPTIGHSQFPQLRPEASGCKQGAPSPFQHKAAICLSLTDGNGVDYGTGDSSVAALLAALPALVDLRLNSGGLQSWSVVGAVAQLTGLKRLGLFPAPHLESQSVASVLQELTGLKGLTELSLPVGTSSLSENVVRHFLMAMPGLPGIKNMLSGPHGQ